MLLRQLALNLKFCHLNFTEFRARNRSWQLNDNLLVVPLCVTDIKKAIMHFMEDHKLDNTAPPIKWVALKYVLRGILISHGSRLKKN